MRSRAIIHLNIADFAAGVETCIDPSLKGYPIIIAPMGAPRAVVYDMSETAFKEGIRKGMPLSQARRINRKIRVLPPRFNRYEQAMKDVFKRAASVSPALESGIRDGHIFLDVTGTGRLYGPPPDVAFRLKKSIQKATGLIPIWSVATNKLVAKVASRVVKPVGEYIVGPGEESAFLAPLPMDIIPGLSREEIERISRFNLVRVAQVRKLSLAQLRIPFDRRAGEIHRLVRGMDTAPVGRSVSHLVRADHEFATDTNDADTLKAGICFLTARVLGKLKEKNSRPGKLILAIAYSDGICHEKTGHAASAHETAMVKGVWDLFVSAWHRRVRIRHIALSCKALPAVPVQTGLFPDHETASLPGQDRLSRAMEEIRTRFGTKSIGPASGLGGLAGAA